MTKIYTIKQTAKILGFSTNTIYKYVNDGTLKVNRTGKQGRIRIPQDSIEKYLGARLPTEALAKAGLPTANEPPSQPSLLKKIPTEPNVHSSKPPLPITIIRVLLILTLLILLLDIVINPRFSLIVQVLRLVIVSIFILITYQFGGIVRKNHVPPPK